MGNNNLTKKQNRAGLSAGICLLAAVGVIMAMQSTSLMNGTGNIWLGVVLVAVSVAAAFILGANPGIRVIAAIALVIALGSALYMENQLSQRRDKISHIFHTSSSETP